MDRNRIQNDRFTSEVMNLEPLSDKWNAFGWNVLEVDGHDVNDIIKAFNKAKTMESAQTVIIAHTVKGKGVSFMENNPAFHGKPANNEEQYHQALKELE